MHSGLAISPDCRGGVAGDFTVHLVLWWQRRTALKQVRDSLRLDLGYRRDCPDGLDEPDEVQPEQLGRNYAAVQEDLFVAGADCGAIEERKADLVALAGAAKLKTAQPAIKGNRSGPGRRTGPRRSIS
jgi:hypothetical protein